MIEKGATWIEDRHVVLKEICKRFNIHMKLQYGDGNSTYLADKTYTPQQLLSHSVYGS